MVPSVRNQVLTTWLQSEVVFKCLTLTDSSESQVIQLALCSSLQDRKK